jgi:hypothetical protein
LLAHARTPRHESTGALPPQGGKHGEGLYDTTGTIAWEAVALRFEGNAMGLFLAIKRICDSLLIQSEFFIVLSRKRVCGKVACQVRFDLWSGVTGSDSGDQGVFSQFL